MVASNVNTSCERNRCNGSSTGYPPYRKGYLVAGFVEVDRPPPTQASSHLTARSCRQLMLFELSIQNSVVKGSARRWSYVSAWWSKVRPVAIAWTSLSIRAKSAKLQVDSVVSITRYPSLLSARTTTLRDIGNRKSHTLFALASSVSLHLTFHSCSVSWLPTRIGMSSGYPAPTARGTTSLSMYPPTDQNHLI